MDEESSEDDKEIFVKAEDKNLANSKLLEAYKKLNAPLGPTPPKEDKKRPNPDGIPTAPKKQKTYVAENTPNARFSDFAGIDSVIKEIQSLIIKPFTHPEIYGELGVDPPRGILLHGAPGTGKSLLANAVAGELGIPFLKISAPEIVSGMSGESEKKIRNLFKEAVDLAPSLIFIDEIDAIIVKREESHREMEVRIVAQILTCMDDLSLEKTGGKMVCVIGATNRPDSLDAALRRAGRFDREISLGMPDVDAREAILKMMVKKLKLDSDFDPRKLAKMTPGYVGADLQSLATEAAGIAVERIYTEQKLDHLTEKLSPEQLADLSISMNDFELALKKVQPSAMREGFVTIPNVSWADIGALEEVREELHLSILEPINHPEKFAKLGLSSPSGVLLYGPPGCGKTLLAKAIANECGANFISVKGPELLNKYVGESERAVRVVFQRARASSPCIIFFDELDALCPRRGGDSSNQSTERVVNQLLTEMDGLESRKMVYVIGATNRPDIIDPAMLRPGRLDKMLFVPLPSEEARISILKTCVRKMPIKGVDIKVLAKRAHHFSGADLDHLCREAAIACYKDNLTKEVDEMTIQMKHFEIALKKVFPSVQEKDVKFFKDLQAKIKREL
jgi:ribosome biogenesis ATPase